MAEADFHSRDRQVVERAVLEAGFTGRENMTPALDGGEVDGAAGKPWATELSEHRVANQQTADTGGVSEHLVERHTDEVGPRLAQA
jgi:hypothetical protein